MLRSLPGQTVAAWRNGTIRNVRPFVGRAPALNAKAFMPPSHHDFFEHTSNTWLYNAKEQQINRYVEFDVAALVAEAVKASNSAPCISFRKFAEGTSNRLFEIKLNDGTELIAKIPYKIAGPAHLTTASEVATMQFMRDMLELPVPKVFAWCSHADETPVGSEYIIMEKMEGVPLSDHWETLRTTALPGFMKELAEIERRMTETHFNLLGSLYFAKDLPENMRSSPLNIISGQETPVLYRIGPSVDRRFWRGHRAHMSIDRGPWKTLFEFTRSAINCEIAWLRNHAVPRSRDSPLFWSDAENDPQTHVRLLEQYALVAPFLNPPESLRAFRLSHPDLHASNVLIDSGDNPHITALLDWQSARIDLLLEAGTVPDFLIYGEGKYVSQPAPGRAAPPPALSAQIDTLPETERCIAEDELRRAKRYQVYTMLTELRNPTLYEHRTLEHAHLCTHPLYWASRTWDEGATFFERTLMNICDAWEWIAPDAPCPISFTVDARRANEEALEVWMQEQKIDNMASDIGIQPDGVVEQSKLNEAKRKNVEVLDGYLADLPQADRATTRRRWPFQDGALSLTAETCR